MNNKELEKLIDSSYKKTYQFASVAHLGQKRRDGQDYITHPLGVYNLLESMLGNLNNVGRSICKHAALLHDVLEDTSYGENDILNFLDSEGIKYSDKILGVVKALTTPKFDGKKDSNSRVKKTISEMYRYRALSWQKDYAELVYIVKCADIIHNLSDYLYNLENSIRERTEGFENIYFESGRAEYAVPYIQKAYMYAHEKNVILRAFPQNAVCKKAVTMAKDICGEVVAAAILKMPSSSQEALKNPYEGFDLLKA